MSEKLSIFGGNKIIKKKFKQYNSIGKAEKKSANKVLKSGILSGFVAGSGKGFLGGKFVQRFEEKLKKFYKVKHAITVNSWTSGLIASVGSLDIEPGDEIITSPFSMCASAISILHWNAIPVFADISKETFCIDPESIKKKITKKTKAILIIDLFGLSHDIEKINKIAKKNRLKVITDSAQAPFSFFKKKIAGTQSDIGGYSYNYHKHIHTGEGGVVVTNDKILAERVRKLRNHAEANVLKRDRLNNMIGFNFRMGELEASIGIAQLDKLKQKVKKRQSQAKFLSKKLSKLEGISVPKIPKNNTHSFYVYPITIDVKKIGVSRKKIFNALVSEGLQGLSEGYANLHLLPVFQKKIAYGKNGFPWKFFKNKTSYKKGICPVAENLHDKELICFELCLFELSINDLNLICKAFKKVWENIQILKKR
tara:strand:+ start:6682 stop:7953 length:1272 start_codon:yes stop_codon:yes gene_type:complete